MHILKTMNQQTQFMANAKAQESIEDNAPMENKNIPKDAPNAPVIGGVNRVKTTVIYLVGLIVAMCVVSAGMGYFTGESIVNLSKKGE